MEIIPDENGAVRLGLFLRPLFIQLFLLESAVCGMPQDMFVRGCLFASIGYWTGVGIILLRRGKNPTAGDVSFLRWGLLPVGILGMIAALSYWSWKIGI